MCNNFLQKVSHFMKIVELIFVFFLSDLQWSTLLKSHFQISAYGKYLDQNPAICYLWWAKRSAMTANRLMWPVLPFNEFCWLALPYHIFRVEMKIAELRWGLRSYGSVLTRETRRPSLVEILWRAWTSALFWLREVSECELQRQQQHRAVTGNYTRIMISLQFSLLLLRSTVFIDMNGQRFRHIKQKWLSLKLRAKNWLEK